MRRAARSVRRRLDPASPPAAIRGRHRLPAAVRQMAAEAGRDLATCPVTVLGSAGGYRPGAPLPDQGVVRGVVQLAAEPADKILPLLDRWAEMIARSTPDAGAGAGPTITGKASPPCPSPFIPGTPRTGARSASRSKRWACPTPFNRQHLQGRAVRAGLPEDQPEQPDPGDRDPEARRPANQRLRIGRDPALSRREDR